MTGNDGVAVLFIECQRGVVGDLSMLPALAEAAAPALVHMGRLAAGARAAGIPVLHLTYSPVAGGRSTNRSSPMMRATSSSAGWKPDSPEVEIVPEIGVADEDIVLTRHSGISPVYRTEVLPMLRNMGVDTIVAAGVSTNWAIPLTVASAADENIASIIPADATAGAPASHHESMLKYALGFVAKLTTVDDLLAEWGQPAG